MKPRMVSKCIRMDEKIAKAFWEKCKGNAQRPAAVLQKLMEAFLRGQKEKII